MILGFKVDNRRGSRNHVTKVKVPTNTNFYENLETGSVDVR